MKFNDKLAAYRQLKENLWADKVKMQLNELNELRNPGAHRKQFEETVERNRLKRMLTLEYERLEREERTTPKAVVQPTSYNLMTDKAKAMFLSEVFKSSNAYKKSLKKSGQYVKPIIFLTNNKQAV